MSLPDLNESKVLQRVEAATQQLDAAVAHFFACEHVACITLAGAAETVLGDLLVHKQHHNSFRSLHENRSGPMRASKRQFADQLQACYNWLRHADRQPAMRCEVTAHESLNWLMRGLASHRKLVPGQQTAPMQKFHEYWLANHQP